MALPGTSQQLTRLTQQPTCDLVLKRAAQHEGGTLGFQQAVDDLDDLRGQG
jgi:hypothetical protein